MAIDICHSYLTKCTWEVKGNQLHFSLLIGFFSGLKNYVTDITLIALRFGRYRFFAWTLTCNSLIRHYAVKQGKEKSRIPVLTDLRYSYCVTEHTPTQGVGNMEMVVVKNQEERK